MSTADGEIESPFVGLDAFEASHADYFFGRRLDAAVIADNVLATPLVVFHGPSGVGKSSLLNVGLPMALRERGVSARVEIRRQWHEVEASLAWLHTIANESEGDSERRKNDTKPPLILVLDQFEEFFLYHNSADADAFAIALANVPKWPDADVHLLLSLREDSLYRLDGLRRWLPRLLDNTLELRHLDESAIREAIERPVAKWNDQGRGPVEIENDFVNELIKQLKPKALAAGNADRTKEVFIELAYLQLALERIWRAEGGVKARVMHTTTLTETLKGVGEIARSHVREVLSQQPEADRELCATLFDRLVTPSGGKQLVRLKDTEPWTGRPASEVEPVLTRLSTGRNRLLRRVELPGEASSGGFEIVHDVLARPIVEWCSEQEALRERRRADEESIKRPTLEVVKSEASGFVPSPCTDCTRGFMVCCSCKQSRKTG